MQRSTRVVLFLLATLLLGAALAFGMFVFVEEVLGQSECDDRGDCSWIGDLAYGESANIVLGACLLVAGCIVWGVGRLVRQAFRRPVRR
jgi:hypothetical protein